MSEANTPAPDASTSTEAASAPPPSPGTLNLYSEGSKGDASPPPADEPVAPEAGEGGSEPAVAAEGEEPKSVAAGDDTNLDPVPVTPEDYEFTLPENFTKDEALEKSAREAFAAAGVPKEHAQPLVDLFASTLAKQQETAQAAFIEQQKAWTSELNALPEFKGQTREKTFTAIGRMWDEYGNDAAKEFMNNPAVGNHPGVVRMMAKLAMALDEGAPAAPAQRPAPNGKDGKPRSGGFGLQYPNTPEINSRN